MTDTEKLILRELRGIRIAFTVIASALVVAILSIAGSLLYWNISDNSSLSAPVGDAQKSPSCGGDAFYKSVSVLLDEAKYKEAIALSDERLKKCPADHYAFFYKAKALAIENQWDRALEALGHAELLRPDWRYAYTNPLRESIEWNKAHAK
jgi:hypothetical protein